MTGRVFTVLGAGRQGLAAAHDFAVHGGAERILLADADPAAATAGALRLDALAGRSLAEPLVLDLTEPEGLRAALGPADAALSALPYGLNPRAAAAAVACGTHFVDLGGNAAVSAEVLALDDAARAAGITLVPDCGLAPGLSASLAAELLSSFDEPRAMRLRCGGLPQVPRGPLEYQLVFSIAGLTNEYLGEAELLRAGEPCSVPTLGELETIEFGDPLGTCEAFTTSGGTSTLPQSLRGRLQDLDYKTVRYPGHCERVRSLRDLGLLSDRPVEVPSPAGAGTLSVRPRDVFHAAAAPRLTSDAPDLVVLRAELSGRHDGRETTRRLEILDFRDESTGFSAMQRMTGYPAAMVAEALAAGEAAAGACPLELVLAPGPLLAGLAARGIRLTDEWIETTPRGSSPD